MTRLSKAAAFLLAAGINASISTCAHAEAQLSKIVSPSLIGVTLKYAEALIGIPAMTEITDQFGTQRNVYMLGKCPIKLGVKAGKVVSVSASIDSTVGCDFDVSGIVQKSSSSETMASTTTFKDYAWRGQLHFTDPQLPSCNACDEGTFNAAVDGIGALGNLDVQLTGWTDSQGYEEWRDLLRKAGIGDIPENSFPMTRATCPLVPFDAQAFELLKNTKVRGIAFGRDRVSAIQPLCSGAAVHELNRRAR